MQKFPTYKTASVESLIPYARNSRTHSDAQVTKIAASIKEFGFLNPVIIDKDSGIVAGHGRVMAAKKLGMVDVPVIQADHLTDAQRRAYVIADNRLALDAGWDDDMLKIEFDELKDLDFNLDVIGFDAEEINLLFNGWDSDIKSINEIESIDSVAKEKIIIKCNQEEHEMLREKITNLIDDLGLHSVEVN
jgi:ParB-like chromosome segregation protein Spo0J